MKRNSEIISILKNNADYRKLLMTTTITGLASWGSFISMLILLGEITDSGIQLGTLWAVSGLVPIAMSFLLGGIVDRLNTNKVIVCCELLKSPLFLFFIFVPMLEGWTAWILFFLIRFFIGILTSLTTVARQTIIPEIMKEEELIVANSLNFTLNSSIRLLGAATGGVLVTFIDLNFFWILTSMAFLFSGFVMATINLKNTKVKTDERNFLQEVIAGITVARQQIFVKYVLLFALTGGLIIGSFNLMLEQMTRNIYNFPPVGLSMLYIAEGLTSVIIGLWIANNKILFKKIHRYGYIYILIGVTWSLFGFTNHILQGLLLMIAFAFVGGFIVPFERQVMQTHVESNVRGRIFGLWNTCSMVSMQIGAFLTGIIIQYVGLRYVPLIVAVLEIFIGLIFLIRFKRETELHKHVASIP